MNLLVSDTSVANGDTSGFAVGVTVGIADQAEVRFVLYPDFNKHSSNSFANSNLNASTNKT